MNKKIISLAIALAVAISAAAFVFNKKFPNPNGEPQPQTAGEGKTSPTTNPTASNPVATGDTLPSTTPANSNGTSGGPSLPVNDDSTNLAVTSKMATVPLTKEETKSVKTMVGTLVKFLDPKMGNPDLLMKEFAKAGMQPVIAKDFNQYTGKMIIVRCENPPQGTRCCHAQYFEDEDKKPFLQHMSFELRPSSDGMAAATAALSAALTPKNGGKLGKAVTQTEDVAHWELKDNYSATIMKLTKTDDIKNDPFCAHELPDDVGMYKVMVEMVPDKDDEPGK